MDRRRFIGLVAAAAAGTALAPEALLKPSGWPYGESPVVTLGIDAAVKAKDMTSVWFVSWGQKTCFYVHPKTMGYLGPALSDDGRSFQGIPVVATDPLQEPEGSPEPEDRS